MKLKFENQAYQLQAVDNTVRLFTGMQTRSITQQLEVKYQSQQQLIYSDAVANGLQINYPKLLSNLQAIQLQSSIDPANYTTELYYGEYANTETNTNIPNFTIEMETGTGKTYVYLRTIFELHCLYNLTKFIIVVPSDAIRLGTLKALEITREHFKAEFNNINYDFYQYNSEKISKVRDFATTNTIQIMVMTIAAFNKTDNVIHNYRDKFGEYKPIDFIKSVNPVVIIDEPQSVDNTEKAKNSIKELNPLVILRYSATHKETYNQIYKLDALDAYNQQLVKQIEVASIENTPNITETVPYIKVVEITSKLELSLELDYKDAKGKITRKIFKKVKKSSDLQGLTNNELYYGYIIADYSKDYGLQLANLDNKILVGDAIGNQISNTLKTTAMIRITILNHIAKELALADYDIKVLSLFFINHVVDYRIHETDTSTRGFLADMFISQLKDILTNTADGKKYVKLCQDKFNLDLTVDDKLDSIHGGYFAKDKKSGNNKDLKDDKDTKDATDAYDLIMKDKETLLDIKTPLRFIFSHSALKEGWDNPNVFQVCVLQDSANTFKRRQQIGRGLRLCVNNLGERIKDTKINTLTVVAAESYNQFASLLQKEYQDDANIKFGYVHQFVFVKNLINDNNNLTVGQAQKISQNIHEVLRISGYIDADNKITETYKKAKNSGLFKLNNSEVEQYQELTQIVLDKLTTKLPIKNSNDKVPIKINPKLYNNEEFKTSFQQLWGEISAKTIYSIKLDTTELVKNIVDDINENLDISKQIINTSRVAIKLDESGINCELMHEYDFNISGYSKINILTPIVNSTGLKRETIKTILTSISQDKLDLYKLHPEEFIIRVIDIINHKKTNF